ncbi:hypothetical protein LRY29_00685 [Candidatus Saccharibacteria bacterium]|nr:hypothetical protein [Candidatus Saccharibacteria bacterium]
MAKHSFKPQSLKRILIFLLFVVIAAGAGLFYLGLQRVQEFGIEVNHRLVDAEASLNRIQGLQLLKNELAQNESLVVQANQVFAMPESYQSQVLTDIRNYADKSGLEIEGTDFGDAGANGTQTVTVRVVNPASYQSLILFLRGIETNLPKMQVASIRLNHVPDGGADSVAVEDFKLEVWIR